MIPIPTILIDGIGLLLAALAAMVYASPKFALSLGRALQRFGNWAEHELRIHAISTQAGRDAKAATKRQMRAEVEA